MVLTPKGQLLKKTILRKADKEFIYRMKPIIRGVAQAFGPHCEVVIHSLEQPWHSCIMIENGHVTGRKVGSPITDLALEIIDKIDSLDGDVVGPYYSKTSDGRRLKSITVILKNLSGEVIGFMCINIDLSTPLAEFMKGFLSDNNETSLSKTSEYFATNIDDLVNKTIKEIMTDVNKQTQISPSQKNRVIVKELFNKGMFDIRGVIDAVAKQMGISRYTVYNYLRDLKLQMRGNSHVEGNGPG